MQKDVLLTKKTEISSAETKQMSNGGFMTRVKDSDGLSYTLFHTKKDKTNTKAFSVFKELPVSGIGSKVELLYKEEAYEKDGNTYTGRQIIGITVLGQANEGEIKLDNKEEATTKYEVTDGGNVPF